ncbi:hypothetical protein AB0D10_11865 [Kitasatospora sp. NPDC048545]|uniref:hypothetical protein n=1 Tax=Kitasatospora sp. NPDC048545 TaxID=3157208 RepID=UPI0033D93069
MKLRTRIRAGATALAVATGGLTFALAGPATAAHACGLSQLGPGHSIWSGGHTVGGFYLAWNSCTAQAYTEAHITNTNWTRKQGQIDVYNYSYLSGGGSHASGPSSPTVVFDGTAWWDSGMLSIYSYPSGDRNYMGQVQFNGCSIGFTPKWNFSGGGAQTNGSDMYC